MQKVFAASSRAKPRCETLGMAALVKDLGMRAAVTKICPGFSKFAKRGSQSWTTLRAIQADITTLKVDAIVNAANSYVARRRWRGRRNSPGGGTGFARGVSRAGRLPDRRRKDHQGLQAPGALHHPHGGSGVARRSPRRGGTSWHHAIGARSKSLRGRLAAVSAFPSISTGVYGYPFEAAAAIVAVGTVNFLSTPTPPALTRLFFAAFPPAILQSIAGILKKVRDLPAGEVFFGGHGAATETNWAGIAAAGRVALPCNPAPNRSRRSVFHLAPSSWHERLVLQSAAHLARRS